MTIEPDEIDPMMIGELELRIDEIGGVHIDAPGHDRLSISKERFCKIAARYQAEMSHRNTANLFEEEAEE